jgi:IS30 family transposase
MGKFAEAAAVVTAPKRCATKVALDEMVTDKADDEALCALVERKSWTAISRVLDVTDESVRRHFNGGQHRRCSCG